MKILLADDVKLYLALEKTFLSRRDYDFLTATSGPSALELLSRERPQLAIIERSLPGIDAFEIRRRLLQDPDLARIPVIVTTSGPVEELRGESERLGISAILRKPFQVADLTQAVQRVLPARSRRHPRFELYLEVGLRPLAGSDYLTAGCVNLSRGGILVELSEPLSVGQQLALQIVVPGPEDPIVIEGQVVRYAKEQQRRGPCFGIEFAAATGADARLRAFLEARAGVPGR